MSSSTERLAIQPALATSVRITPHRLVVTLSDGRAINAPLDRFPRLLAASPVERRTWEINAAGTAIRWPDIDGDIGIAGLLRVPETLVEEAAGFTIHAAEPRRQIPAR